MNFPNRKWLGGMLVIGLSLLVVATAQAVDPLEALELLRQKKEFEEKELKRLSTMQKIPAGEFVMGRNGVNKNEAPARTVYLDAFYIDTYEVTQLQYLEVMKSNPSYFNECSLCPVEKVTYYQAAEYCSKLGKRLPTEAEWEKAARAGTQTTYHWGKDLIDFYAWYGNNSGGRTQPVGQRRPNAFGLYDMTGNVWEWVADWYSRDYYKTAPAKNPRGPETGTLKSVRGGGWGVPPELQAHAYRDFKEPDTRYINVGFRCARDAKP
ncbi:formylglycine-generating enzyme family protein [Nitrospina gracilis]|uniref:formylglycine-generating enzyme family protein n=1 Tax=Nitrospina gracilis TaxID=35801 RepID=UPI001F2FC4AC|nr:formylglycine-generating enzyme family protein [Nitrospina gracilis]MCF8720181.1 formylglycine-generating enzyme required for sulfatase activity [Nitrospina gracilis Nb-211]